VSKGKYINVSANNIHVDIARVAHNPDPSIVHEPDEGDCMRPVPGAEWSAPFRHMERDLLTLLDLVEISNTWGCTSSKTCRRECIDVSRSWETRLML